MTLEVDQQFLMQIEERLIISYRYDQRAHTFVLITELVDMALEGNRDFVRITCSEVSDFVRTPGLFKPMQRFTTCYSLRESVVPVIVQLAELTKRGVGYSLILALGSDFGRLSLTCSTLSAEVKRSRATEYEQDKWRYFDADSGVEFDYLAPFD